MGNHRKTATTTQSERVTRAVEQELQATAAARWRDGGEEFLWRSRRCLEAMLYALLFEKNADITSLMEGQRGLDELLKQPELKGVLPREVRDHIDTVRKYGNTGTHFQVDGDVGETSTRNTANAFAEVIRWYFTRNGSTFPKVLDRPMAALTDSRHRIPGLFEAELEAARARAASLEHQLQARAAPRNAPAAATRSRVLPWVFGLCAAVITSAFGYAIGRSATSPPTAQGPKPPPPTLTTTGTIEPTPVPIPSMPTPVPVDGSLLPAPDDPASPDPTADLPPRAPPLCTPSQRRAVVGGRSLCVDAEFVYTRDYQRCVQDGACPAPTVGTGCNWQNGPAYERYAANCVTREGALAYCAWKYHDRGALPSRAEWRAVRVRRDVVRRDDSDEWTADDAPDGRAWTRGRQFANDFVWARVAPNPGSRGIAFRCVVR